MQHCFELSLMAEGRTAPNPMVGAVVLDAEGEVVGSGYHHAAGQPHAEVNALDEAGDRAKGGTIYVSLEPCCHFGKTPPCTQKVIASGVKRVVAAIGDPNPVVAGKGFAELREHGIEVVENVMLKEAAWLNRGFFQVKITGRPWVCLKLATTLDGKIADRFKSSKWITGEQSRLLVHEMRNRLDCVLVGAGTARADDPSLNVRDISNGRNPIRAVIDPFLTLSPASKLCQPDTGGETIIFCAKSAREVTTNEYPSHVKVIPVGAPATDLVKSRSTGLRATENTADRQSNTSSARTELDLVECLQHLANEKVGTVLCEGGGWLSGSLLRAGLIDEIYWFCAPKLLGDIKAVSAIAHEAPVSINQAFNWELIETKVLGGDVLIHCVKPSWSDFR